MSQRIRLAWGGRIYRDEVMVFSLALIVRLWHVLETRSALVTSLPVGDGRAYDGWARAIAGGDWLGTGVFYQAPLYPYFLGVVYALVDPSPLAARIAQAIVGALAAMLLVPTGRTLLDRRSGLIGGVLFAIYPPLIFYDGLIQKTALDVTFTVVFLLAAARIEELASGRDDVIPRRLNVRVLAMGAALGFLTLTRENAIALITFVLPWLAWRLRPSPRGYVRYVLWFALGLSIPLAPVGIRNLAQGGEFALTTAQLGPNFYLGNNPYTDGRYLPLREGRGDARYEREDATVIAEAETGSRLTPSEVSRFWLSKSFAWIKAHPDDWLALCAKKVLLSLNAIEVSDTESIEAYRDVSSWLRFAGPFLHFGTLVPLAMAGVWLTRREWRRAVLLHGTAAVLFAGLVVFFVFGRYRAPCLPALCLLAGAALAFISRIASSQRYGISWSRRDLVGACLIGGCTAALANVPRSEGPAQHSLNYYSVGSALLEIGRNAEAGAALERAAAIRPEHGPTIRKLAVVRWRQGRFDDAETSFSHAIRLRPEDADAHVDYGTMLFEQGRFADAEVEFRVGYALRPNDSDLACNLGASLIELGRIADAVPPLEDALRLRPDHELASANLGRALFLLNRFPEASVHADRAAQLMPGNARNQYLAGTVHEALGDTAVALGYYERTLRVDPGNTEARARWTRLRSEH